MHYLIDGHNLIARVPGLSLADPDDEAKLVQLLKRWAAADTRRKVTVIFDKGLPGGEAKHLSGGGVRALFAPDNRSADALLIRRIEGETKTRAQFEKLLSPNLVDQVVAGKLSFDQEGQQKRGSIHGRHDRTSGRTDARMRIEKRGGWP